MKGRHVLDDAPSLPETVQARVETQFPQIAPLLRRLLAKMPDSRPESAAEVVAELDAIDTQPRNTPAPVSVRVVPAGGERPPDQKAATAIGLTPVGPTDPIAPIPSVRHSSGTERWRRVVLIAVQVQGLASFFSEGDLDIYRCDVRTGEKSHPKFLFPELGGISAEATLAERRAAADTDGSAVALISSPPADRGRRRATPPRRRSR